METVDDMPTVTVGELRERLADFPDDAEIVFGTTAAGDHLGFYRVKDRGQRPRPPHTRIAQIELNEYAPR